MYASLKREKNLLLALLLTVLAYAVEHSLTESGRTIALVATGLMILTIVLASLRVAHHAELLAHRVGDPYGTMILTLSAVLVEVVILAIMLSHTRSPTLARDTIYSAVMLDVNGILGIAAVLGGLKHGEQPYNVDSGNSYIVMIMTAMGVSMVVPEFVPMRNWQTYSIFTIVLMLVLYGMFLRLQTGQHSHFFRFKYVEARRNAHGEDREEADTPLAESVLCLASGIVIIGLLAEVMSKTLEVGIEGTGVPAIVGALLVAIISASPEVVTAMRAALGNRMQPVVNIALGASLSTVILTVPVIEAIALFTGRQIEMAMTPVQTVMITLTMLVAAINLHDGETNAIEGITHFVLFATFLMLSLMGI